MNPIHLAGTWRLAEPGWLLLGCAAVVLPLVVLWARSRRERRLGRFAVRARLDELIGPQRRWNAAARAGVAGLACLMLAAGLARPQSNPREVESERTGRDVIFLLDVSRSMLATDVAPNRLERAKLWIGDLVAQLRGDRFALVAFAGSASVRSPLTSDRLFFRMTLDELTPDSVSRGGTNIGDAIRKTLELVIPPAADGDAGGFRDIILITDGEDQGSLPVEAARAAAQRGVRIIALGIGSPQGAEIKTSDGSGRTVRTRLDSATLADIAAATPGGAYLEVGAGTVDLAELYSDLIATAPQGTLESGTTVRYTERFAWFLWPALALLFAERILIPQGLRRSA